MLRSIVSLEQGYVKKSKKLVKIINIEEENFMTSERLKESQ